MPVAIATVQTADRLTNQLQQNIKSAVEPPFQGATGTFLTTLTGCTTVPANTISWEAGVDGRMVALVLPTMIGTSNSGAATITGLPSGLWPANSQTVLAIVKDNGGTQLGTLTITPQGKMTLALGAASGSFTASGSKGVITCTVVYARQA